MKVFLGILAIIQTAAIVMLLIYNPAFQCRAKQALEVWEMEDHGRPNLYCKVIGL